MKTNKVLLAKAMSDLNSEAWLEMVQSYQPLIEKWVLRFDNSSEDVSDISQEVLITLVRELPNFEHNGRTGAFRSWLRTITVNQIRAHWRKRNRQPVTGTQDTELFLDQLTDPNSELSKRWNQEHDRHVFEQLLNMMKREFSPKTMIAFKRFVIDEENATKIANDLQVSTGQIYKLKFRVMQRLKQRAEALYDSGLDTIVGPLSVLDPVHT